MVTLPNFPMVSQLTTVTGDGKPSENAMLDCVAASIDAVCRYLLGTPENSIFNPDHLKDIAYGEAYTGGTSADHYVAFCKSIGIDLYSWQHTTPSFVVSHAHELLAAGNPVIFTEVDPYVDTALPQYAGWTHVCVWFADDAHGLTALDPYIGKPVYKTDATWASLLRSNQLWTGERIGTVGIPQNWHDTGSVLTAPNGIPVVLGFRDYILSHPWDAANVPLSKEQGTDRVEESHPELGKGTEQLFMYIGLYYTLATGVQLMHLGEELAKTRQQAASLYADNQTLRAQLTALQTGAPIADPRITRYEQVKNIVNAP